MQAEFEPAQAAYQECLLRVPDARSAREALLGIAEAHAKRAQLQAAFAAYRHAEQLMQRVWAGFPTVHRWLLRELGRHDEARHRAVTALGSLEGLEDRPLLARLHADLAHAACLCNDPGLARKHLDADTARMALAEARSGFAALAEQLDGGVQRERLELEAERMGLAR